jgi:protein-tyrosine-phosphatase
MCPKRFAPVLLASLVLLGCTSAPKPMPKRTILFLCPAGGAKSVIATSYFNRLAQEQSLPYVAIAAAAETPYDAVPSPVADLLEAEGFDVRSFKPRHVEEKDIQSAARVVSIGCNLDGVNVDAAPLEKWDDVPKVSDGLRASADAIRKHVEKLVAALRAR